MKNTQLSNTTVNAQAAALSALLNSGFLKIYAGTQPTNANTAVTTQTLLATLGFSATAAPAPSNGVLTFNAISSASAVASGTATWFRCLESDGVTVVMDGSIDISANTPNMVFNSVAISSGALVQVTGFTHSVLESTAGD